MGQYFASKFVAALKTARTSQDQVADAFGISQQQVSKWATGSAMPGNKRARRLAEILGVSRAEVLEWMADDAEEERQEAEQQRQVVERKNAELITVVREFVDQYKELGHSYRRLDDDVQQIKKDLEGLPVLRRQMEEMVGLIVELSQQLKGRG